jgi:hypothetical protein
MNWLKGMFEDNSGGASSRSFSNNNDIYER